MNAGIEALAIDTLLENGVPLPKIKAPLFFRVFGCRTLKVYQPTLGNKLRINRRYLKLNISDDVLHEVTHKHADQLMIDHGFALSRIVAIGMLKGLILPWLLAYPFGLWIMWNLSAPQINGIASMLIMYSGTADFINTIRCIESLKVTAPNLSQNPNRS